MSGLTLLKSLMPRARPVSLEAGNEFRLGLGTGGFPEDDCVWKVRAVRPFRGIPHALIEQLATGKTKTIAVSAILGDRTFEPIHT